VAKTVEPETWFIRGEGGGIYEMSLPLHEVIAHQLLKGYSKRVNADGTDYVETTERTRPAINAAKAEWVSWAVHRGERPDDAEAATKTDLIEKYGL
jgi:hypothetical protein